MDTLCLNMPTRQIVCAVVLLVVLVPPSVSFSCSFSDIADCACGTNNPSVNLTTAVVATSGCTKLSIRVLGLTTIPPSLFDHHRALAYLYLDYNYLKALPAGLFKHTTALTYLDLGNNQLTSLRPGLFDHTTRLEFLYLHGSNQLTDLPSGLFDYTTMISTLALDGNLLATLPPGLFDHTVALQTLNIDWNRLTSLPSGLFDHTSALAHLYLQTNRLTALPSGLFDHSTALQTLWLHLNDLKVLPLGLFDKATALDYLRLNSNELTNLTAGLFDYTTALRILQLQYNQLTGVASGLLDQTGTLELLYLNNNQLTALPSGLFDNTPVLTSIKLQLNPGFCQPSFCLGALCEFTVGNTNPPGGFTVESPPRGSFCEAGHRMGVITPCPTGTYKSTAGGDVCYGCPGGVSYCPNSSTVCPETFVCEGAQAFLLRCPARWYCPANATYDERVKCPAGSFCAANSRSPVACSNGQYCSEGSASEETCPVGHACPTPAIKQACALGTFASPTEATLCYLNDTFTCALCPLGRFANRTGATECHACSPGQYAPVRGMSVCFGCAIGYASPVGALAECTPCQQGSYSQSVNSSACELCDPGKFNNAKGKSLCVFCPAGQTSTTAGAVTCSNCSRGRYELAGQCIDCSPGSFNDELGIAFNCTPCDIGKSTFLSASVACQLCPEGTEAASAGQSECGPCGTGRFKLHRSELFCRDCFPGTAVNLVGSIKCQDCDPGRFAAGNATSVCHECPVGTYQGGYKATRCRLCKEGKFSTVTGAKQCATCPVGFYMLPRVQKLGEEPACILCPKGLQCNPNDGTVSVQAGYWASFDADTGTMASIKCLPGYCVGVGQNGEALCASGRKQPASVNPMCGQCEDGLSQWGHECLKCDGTQWGILVLGFLLNLLFILIYLVLTQSSSGAIKVFVYYTQMALLFVDASAWAHWFAVLNLDILSMPGSTVCLFAVSQRNRMLLSMVLPALSIVQLALVAGLHWCVIKSCCMELTEPAAEAHSVEDAVVASMMPYEARAQGLRLEEPRLFTRVFDVAVYTRTLIGLYLFTFNTTVFSVFTYLDCVSLPDGSSYVRSYPAVNCSSSEWKSLLAPAVTLICVWLVVLPSFFFYKLYHAARTGRLKLRSFRQWFGVLHEPFAISSYYWGLVVLFRRTALVAAWVFLSESSQTRVGVISLINMLFLCLQLVRMPFGESEDDTFESISLATLLVITICLGMTGDPFTFAQNVLMGILVIGTAVLLLLRTLFHKIMTQYDACIIRKGWQVQDETREETLASSDRSSTSYLSPTHVASSSRVKIEMERGRPVTRDDEDGSMNPHTREVCETAGLGASAEACVPTGWAAFLNDDGVPYYHNEATGEVTWDMPRAV